MRQVLAAALAWGGLISAVQSVEARGARLISTVPLGAYLKSGYDSQLGPLWIANGGRQFFSTRSNRPGSRGGIDSWDLKRGHIVSRLVPPEQIDAGSVQASPHSRFLIATQELMGDARPIVYDPHRLFVWSLRTRKLLRTVEFGPRVNLDKVAFLPGRDDQVLVAARFSKNGVTNQQQHVFRVNLGSGRVQANARHRLSKYLLNYYAYTLFSSDGHLLARVDTLGEGQPGYVDVVDVKSGRLLRRFQGDFTRRPVYDGVFFLPGRRFFFMSAPYGAHVGEQGAPAYRGLVFDIPRVPDNPGARVKTRRVMEAKCLAALPSRPGCAFFDSARGLELWDVPRHKRLRRWPELQRVERIMFSRDGRTAGFYFWRSMDIGDGLVTQRPGSEAIQFWCFS